MCQCCRDRYHCSPLDFCWTMLLLWIHSFSKIPPSETLYSGASVGITAQVENTRTHSEHADRIPCSNLSGSGDPISLPLPITLKCGYPSYPIVELYPATIEMIYWCHQILWGALLYRVVGKIPSIWNTILFRLDHTLILDMQRTVVVYLTQWHL
jgi:hypothetical protein